MSDGQMFQCTNRFRPPPLDQTSRRTLGYFASKLGVIFAFATIGAIFDNHPMLRFCSVVQPLAFLIGITAIAGAYLSGEAPRGQMLNQWDKAFAFAAIGLAVKIGARFLSS